CCCLTWLHSADPWAPMSAADRAWMFCAGQTIVGSIRIRDEQRRDGARRDHAIGEVDRSPLDDRAYTLSMFFRFPCANRPVPDHRRSGLLDLGGNETCLHHPTERWHRQFPIAETFLKSVVELVAQ